MGMATVLERPAVVEFENIRRLLEKGNEHGKKYGITEDVIAAEIEIYRKEKEQRSWNENFRKISREELYDRF
jgi:hypothetical protein